MTSNVKDPQNAIDKVCHDEGIKAQVVELLILFNLKYSYIVLSTSMQHWLIDYQKCSYVYLSEIPLRETHYFTNFE
jgi:hypothetical protein